MSFFLSSNAKRKKKTFSHLAFEMFKAVSCKAVSCVINPVELLGPVGPMRLHLGWISLGSCQESKFTSTGLPVEFPENPIWDHLGFHFGPGDCQSGSMGLPFGVHGTAIWGPWDCCLGSMGLLFGVHVSTIWGLWDCRLESMGLPFRIQCDCHMKAIVLQFCGS